MNNAAPNNDHFESAHQMAMRFSGLLLSAVLCIPWFAPVQAQSQSPGLAPRQERAPTPAPGRQALPPTPGPASAPMPGLRPSPRAESAPMYAPSQAEDEIAVLVVAGEETTLSSQMGGRVLRVNVGLGDTVEAKAVLLEFDCSEQQAQLQSAQAEFRGLRETHLTKLKLQALGAAGELEVTVAASAADKAKSQLDLRESQMAYCQVSAPFAGRVARLRVKTSESVNINVPLVELVNTSSLKAQMFVPSTYIRVLKPGMPFQVKLESGQIFRARINKLNSRVEGVSQQLEIEGRFDGTPQGLLPGMVGTAQFPVRPGR